MIISTGMRTDIPAFYSQWFLNRIKAGFVYVRNPYYENQVTKYVLDPSVVDCLCFCTKNPIPMLPHLDEIKNFGQFWFVTITPYGKDIEPKVPDKNKVIEAFKQLSNKVGRNAVGWRYDPVFYGEGFDFQAHIEQFDKIAKALRGYTDLCVVSFLDLYQKVKKNAPGIRPPTIAEQVELGKAMAKIASENGIKIRTCCEGTHLAPYGIDVSGCQTKEVIERAIGLQLNPPKRKNARAICDCLLGQDIGAYNTCGHLCKYCYANADKAIVLENIKRHDPNSPFLIGNLQKGDKITPAKQESFVNLQTKFDL
jgi:hypothetical protein